MLDSASSLHGSLSFRWVKSQPNQKMYAIYLSLFFIPANSFPRMKTVLRGGSAVVQRVVRYISFIESLMQLRGGRSALQLWVWEVSFRLLGSFDRVSNDSTYSAALPCPGSFFCTSTFARS